MLEKNLTALQKTNPELAAQIQGTSLSNRIELFLGPQQDVNIAYDGIALHNIDNPMGEALQLMENGVPEQSRKDSGIIILFGLGLGYLLRRVFVSTQAQIIVFEPDLVLLRQTLETVDFTNELSSNRVQVFTHLDDMKSVMHNAYLLGDAMEILILPSYQQREPELILEFLDKMKYVLSGQTVDQTTGLVKSKEIISSSLKNLPYCLQYPSFQFLENQCQGMPGLLISAGPSLDRPGVLDLIQQNRDHFVISCVGQVAKALDKANIVPDFVNFLESVEVYKQLEGTSFQEDANLVLLPQTHRSVFKLPTLRKIISYSAMYPFTEWMSRLLDMPLMGYRHEGTVSISALIHLMVMGCNPIFMIGQDLAFPEGKIYAQSAHNRGWRLRKDEQGNQILETENKAEEFFGLEGFAHSDLSWEIGKQQYVDRITDIRGWHGETLQTLIPYKAFCQSFEALAKDNPKFKIINCSEGGAYINGFEHLPLQQALKKYDVKTFYPGSHLKSYLETHYCENPLESRVCQDAFAFYQKDKKALLTLKENLDKGLEAIQKIQRELSRIPALTHSLESRIKKMEVLEEEIIQQTKTYGLLNCYIEEALFFYNKTYARKMKLSETIGENKVKELQENLTSTTQLYEGLNQGADELLEALQEAFNNLPQENAEASIKVASTAALS